ncbi:MAG: response regulator, partial [bacterium]
MEKKPVVLIVDDEEIILKTLKEVLEDEGYSVQTVAQASQTLDHIGKLIPDIVLLDIFMPKTNGLDLLTQIKKEYPGQKVIMISGYGNIPIALESIQKGALDFIEKPLNLDDILSKISFLKRDVQWEEACDVLVRPEHDYELHGIVGKSFLFQELMSHIQQVALLDLPALIYGQYGTGKSLFANYIHNKGHLSAYSFITIDCAGRGNFDFSDAMFEKTGTFYFKNIQELSLELQKKFLSWLESTDFSLKRVLASSNVPLFNCVKNGSFNSVLFHKLNIIPLEIPALNKRRHDIPLLAHYFLGKENKKQNKSIIFSNSSIRLLRNHDWKGNIGELKQSIEKTVSFAPEEDFVVAPAFLRQYMVSDLDKQFIEEQQFVNFESFGEAKNAFEKTFLLYHLKKNNYDLTQVSERLNLNIPQLR